MATDGKTVFVPVVNAPLEVVTQTERQEPGPLSGELVALDVKTGALKWKHEFPTAAAFGFTTVANDLVFATTSDGNVQAFDTELRQGRLAGNPPVRHQRRRDRRGRHDDRPGRPRRRPKARRRRSSPTSSAARRV